MSEEYTVIFSKDSNDYYKYRLLMENNLNVFQWSEENQIQYNDLYETFVNTTGKPKSEVSDEEKGKSLEDIVEFLFSKTSIFQYIRNHRTGDFELDIILKLSNRGIAFKDYISIAKKTSSHLIGECKNYKKPLSITYTGKFYSLLDRYNLKLGIIFSYHGLAGSDECKGWTAASGFTKKMYLKNDVIILDFNQIHFNMIRNGKSFIDVLNGLMEKTIFDIDDELNYIQHEDIGTLI